MASPSFTWKAYLLRLILAFILVFATYNPSHFSYFHWAIESFQSLITPEELIFPGFVGITILVGWVILLRATLRALGGWGIILTLIFFVALFALIIHWFIGWEHTETNFKAVQYILLSILSFVLGTGVSYQIFLIRLSGVRDIQDI